MKPAAERVQAELRARGVAREVVELPVEARTSQQAADALGVSVAQIAKSLVFTVARAAGAAEPVMVVVSGAHRVDEAKLAALTGGRVRRADAAAVREATGYVIGGVAPVGHRTPLPVYVERGLLAHSLVYAAAGVPECVVPLSPGELVRVTGADVVDVAAAPGPAA